jgi:ssDNA-binding Zn-finger/Zn-ribbon topoisomerase 1
MIEAKMMKTLKKVDVKPGAQTTVVVTCPNCSNRHDHPLDKGKNGKPFFMACARCKTDFAVRFVQVMTYQAQVAGFK